MRSVGVPTVPFEQLLDHFADDDILAIACQKSQGEAPVRLQIIANERSYQQVLLQHRLLVGRLALDEPSGHGQLSADVRRTATDTNHSQ